MIEYKSWSTIPATLATKAALRKRGLKPAKGQQPVARKVGGYGPYALYLIADAIPASKPTPAQLTALEKARNLIGTFICAGCGERKEQTGAKWGRCYDCYLTRELAEHATFIEEERKEAIQWARTMLTDPRDGCPPSRMGAMREGAVILDTETTGLDDAAEIVQIAIIATTGATLLDSLVLPSHFPATYHQAEAIHGISRERLTDVPTILDLWPQILAILDCAQHIVVYNADFDFRLLRQSLAAHGVQRYQPGRCTTHPDCLPGAVVCGAAGWQIHCAMKWYAQYWGEYSTRHGSFTWQRLPGGDHTALGDCLATLNLLRQMANEEKTEGGDVPTRKT